MKETRLSHASTLRGRCRLQLLALLLTASANGCVTSEGQLAYLGETPPDTTPNVFGPGRVSLAGRYEFGSVFSRTGEEFFFGVDTGGRSEIHWAQLNEPKTAWSAPEVLLSHEQFGFNDPMLSPDEQRLYFISNRPRVEGQPKRPDHDIWFVERLTDGWSEPINVGAPINTEVDEYYISFLADGSMVFASNIAEPDRPGAFDIYLAQAISGPMGRSFAAPVALGSGVNTQHYEADAFITQDGTQLVFSSQRPGSNGRGDLYVSFRRDDGTWTDAKHLGPEINTADHELCPFITADGRYLFYTSNEDLKWVATSTFDDLR